MNKVAIILSGCGNRDGSELQETLALALALDRNDVEYQYFAPRGEIEVYSYLDNTGTTGEKRQLFDEAARIARGNILDLATYSAKDYDGLALPGGMGAARNLSSYDVLGTRMSVHPLVERAIKETHAAKKPICAMCIAPILLAKVLGEFGVGLTLGNPGPAAEAAEEMGALHYEAESNDCVVDRDNRVVTTPAYMVAHRISEIFDGAEIMVEEFVKLLSL